METKKKSLGKFEWWLVDFVNYKLHVLNADVMCKKKKIDLVV